MPMRWRTAFCCARAAPTRPWSRLSASGILDAEGAINRRALGAIVFNDDAALERLEALTHPVIRSEIDRRARASAAVVVVIEAIKLLEGGLKDVVDAVWVVNASEERQLARLMAGRGLPAGEAARRIALQNSQADKLRQADVVIENDGELAATRAQVERAWAEFSHRATEAHRQMTLGASRR